MTEEWRTISIAPSYEVSCLGNVRRSCAGKSTYIGKPVNKFLRKGDPYHHVVLCLGQRGNQITRRVHTLVADAFVGPRPSIKHYALHCDGKPLNNRSDNLRWGLQHENMQDAVAHGMIQRGEQKSHAVLTDERVRILRAAKASGVWGAVTRLAREWGVNQGGANMAALGRTWKHVATEPGAVLEIGTL